MRKVFFSFDYDRDVWRAAQVRNSCQFNVGNSGFIDKAGWEKIKQKDALIKKWITNELKGTSVTVVLIGYETSKSKWVNYEIKESIDKGNGLLGIHIHSIENQLKKTDSKGTNPLDSLNNTNALCYNTYDWINDCGYKNLPAWIEKAAKQ